MSTLFNMTKIGDKIKGPFVCPSNPPAKPLPLGRPFCSYVMSGSPRETLGLRRTFNNNRQHLVNFCKRNHLKIEPTHNDQISICLKISTRNPSNNESNRKKKPVKKLKSPSIYVRNPIKRYSEQKN